MFVHIWSDYTCMHVWSAYPNEYNIQYNFMHKTMHVDTARICTTDWWTTWTIYSTHAMKPWILLKIVDTTGSNLIDINHHWACGLQWSKTWTLPAIIMSQLYQACSCKTAQDTSSSSELVLGVDSYITIRHQRIKRELVTGIRYVHDSSWNLYSNKFNLGNNSFPYPVTWPVICSGR